jgi:hypothetical protein
MLTDCGNVPWTNLNKAKLNNGYIRIPLPSSNNPATTETTSIMDYESSSDAALLDQQEQRPLNRDTSVLLLDVNSQQQQLHSNIINNPSNSSNLASPQHQHHVPSLRNNSISSSTSPTNKSQSVAVVVNLGNPNSMQTIATTLQRNNVKNSSTKSNRSNNSIVPPIGNNNVKPSDNINIFKAHNNSRKYKFNLLKLSSSSGGASRSTWNRLLIFAICLIIFGIAIGALTVHLSGIYHCNPDRIGTYSIRWAFMTWIFNVECWRWKTEASTKHFTLNLLEASLPLEEMKGTFYELVSYEQANLIQNSCESISLTFIAIDDDCRCEREKAKRRQTFHRLTARPSLLRCIDGNSSQWPEEIKKKIFLEMKSEKEKKR